MSDIDLVELESLRRETKLLNERVARLEKRMGMTSREPEASPEVRSLPTERLDTTGVVAVLGKALLGLAGAYLLRALTENGTLPAAYGVGLGIVYAAIWLWLASRFAAAQRLTAIIYALTSVLVLSPMIWEAATRFHAITSWSAAITLTSFAVFGVLISWKHNVAHISSIGNIAAVLTSAALLMWTHDVVPFTCVFLIIAASLEIAAVMEHWLKERFLVATILDLAVLLMTWLVTRTGGLPEGYGAIPPVAVILIQSALLTVYLASAMARTLWRVHAFSNLEVFQLAVAFCIGVGGGLRTGKGVPAIAAGFALFTLLGGAVSYLVSFTLLERRGGHDRNFYIYSSFGLLLTIAGAGILLAPTEMGATLILATVACLWIGGCSGRNSLLWHGVFYLMLSITLSEAMPDAVRLLLTSTTGLSTVGAPAWIAAAGTLISCVLIAKFHGSQFAVLLITLVGAVTSAGLAAGALTGIPHSEPAYCATLRTAVLLGTALALAWSAKRWSQPAYSKAVYVLMAIGAYKLLVQELPGDRTLALVASLFLYGATLMLLPRFATSADKRQSQ